jgi:hypothetical protein
MNAEMQADTLGEVDGPLDVYNAIKFKIVRWMLGKAEPLAIVGKTASEIGVRNNQLRQIAKELGREIRRVDGQWVDVKARQSAKAIAKSMAGLPDRVSGKAGYELLRQAGFELDENDPADRWKVARARKLAGFEVEGSANDSVWVKTRK